jgi:cytochrome c oxidase cbb3-type subunit 3
MSNFLNWFITIISVGSFLGCVWLIWWSSRPRHNDAPEGEVTGHTWDDGTLAEYNNPLPRWWLWLFYITIIFGLVYFFLYPAMGNYKGSLGWTQEGQYDQEMAKADQRYEPIFKAYAEQPIPALAKNEEAMKTGRRLFINYCSSCHGSDAGGAPGFPSLKDKDWLYGGSPENIETTILNGRMGNMPNLSAAIGGQEGVDELANYVLSLSGNAVDKAKAEAGKAKFAVCAGCHGMDGKGNTTIGAPNLTDDIWLYGGSLGAIKKTISNGRNGVMPAHKDFLGTEKVHLLAAYVYSLSNP